LAKAPATGTRRRAASLTTRAWQTLTWLLILIIGLTGLNWLAVALQGGHWTPKLALDLEGGTQMVIAAQLPAGEPDPSAEQMQQAVSIIRQRIDAAGVSEAEITTQGGRNIVVSVPGEMDELTRQRIANSAKLEFRAVLYSDSAANSQIIPPDQLPAQLSNTPTAEPTSPSDLAQITEQMQVDFIQFDCSKDRLAATEVDPTKPLITCDESGTEKFILGPVEVTGDHIKNATSGLATTKQGASTNQWVVNLEFDPEGTAEFSNITQRLVGLQGNQNRFAATLDNTVIVAPTTNVVIADGKAQISGTFTQESSKALADQLKFGALPFNFVVQSSSTISATLGASQLEHGLIAGLIGLVLVVVYSLIQYRTLGLVTIASLALSGGLAYLAVTFLSNQEGYRLSLAGVAGLIVSIGITADSFIVYFERIKDELRDGRGLVAAVENGWSRAIRTILVSDGVNFLVSIVLFIIAVGNVRGFALTLGVTTLIDVVVVALFTHPLMRLLARTHFFSSGHPASGLDPNALGAVYRGRGTFRKPSARTKGGQREAERRQTLAERKAAEAAAAAGGSAPDSASGSASDDATSKQDAGDGASATSSGSRQKAGAGASRSKPGSPAKGDDK